MDFSIEDLTPGLMFMAGGDPLRVYQDNAHKAVTAAEERGAPITLVFDWRNRIITAAATEDIAGIKAVQREAEGYARRPDQTLFDQAAEKARKAAREVLPSGTSIGLGMGAVLVLAFGALWLWRGK